MPTSRHPRRPPRLPTVFDAYRHAPVYFVTFSTHQRKPWLAQSNLHAAFLAFLQRGWNERRIAVGRYAIMPDHIHLLVSGGPAFDLGGWVKLLKQCLGKAAGPNTRERLWQEGFFDHLIRCDEKLVSVWEYLRQNPRTAGLSEATEDWPYQGEFMVLDRV
jgi:REP element-mobilizing transposase RayT